METTVSKTKISPMDAEQAFAVPGSDSIVDVIHPATGKSWIAGETLEQIRLRYPGAEVVNFDEWCKAKGDRQNSPVAWTEVSEKQYWDWLECLPPVAMKASGFMVGEPSDHHAASGQPRYQACVRVGDKHYASNRPMTVKEFTAAYEAGIKPEVTNV
jgi:hypothetical protein